MQNITIAQRIRIASICEAPTLVRAKKVDFWFSSQIISTKYLQSIPKLKSKSTKYTKFYNVLGFVDMSENPLYPGRVCSAEMMGCNQCNYHGSCIELNDDEVVCECFQWYAGEKCQYNLKGK